MDNNTVIECATLQEAKDAQEQIHSERVTLMQSLGYTIINNEIVPKNAMTGEDDLEACRTSCWDVPQETDQQTYTITSPPDDLDDET